ncbi:MAG TPA: ShlB/FhaC/HecB family hemolysin secretion/activation protein [Allosphingosinicella sp.]|nr:ShlB/FhaC/HecB family hemolysin secretion/activation protein [Allosphingosinicella sp.]
MLKFSLVTMALLATSQTAFAQQAPPGAGGQLQQIPPAPAPEKKAPELQFERPGAPDDNVTGGATVRVESVRVAGNSLFSEAELIAVADVRPGREMSLSDLRAAAARIADFYNERGYILAQAYLPAQDIKDGIVTIAVVEGRYGKVDLRNGSHLSDASARRILNGLESGDPVANGPLERRLLLLSDIPGVRVKSTLAPGTEIGTSDVIVDIVPGRSVSGSIEADNAGNRYTGTYRLGGTLYLNNPMGMGDQVSLRLLGSTGGLAYGRAAYQLPVGNATIGAAFTHLRYALGREFDVLDADGSADIFSLFGSYPLIRSRRLNLNALAAAEYRLLEDRIGLVSSESDKDIRAMTIGFGGDSRDDLGGGGLNVFSAGWTIGRLGLESPAERAVDSLTARSQGGYGKLQFSAARLQTLSGPFSLYGAVRGQLAFDNLDSSEKMELGGAYGVRAYPEGEAYGDQGYIATAEARLMLSQWTGNLPGRLQLIAFVDAGEVRFAHDPWFTGSNHASRSGYGAGLVWAGPRGFVARASYARKLGDAPATSAPDRSGRFWFQVTKLF